MTELKPKLIIIAGPNGSGKTSVTHKILQHDWMEGCVYVNPDNADYFVRLFFVGTDSPAINASRIARRVMEGGHDVPIAKIISRYSKSIANCALAAKIADRAYVYDNSVDYADPQLLFRVTDGRLEKKYGRINDWANEILKIL